MSRPKKNFPKKRILEAIAGSNGLTKTVADRLGCNWHTAKRNIESFPETREAFEDEAETVLDFTESELIKAIKKGEPWAIRLLLTTKGKTRGYTQQVEISESASDIPSDPDERRALAEQIKRELSARQDKDGEE